MKDLTLSYALPQKGHWSNEKFFGTAWKTRQKKFAACLEVEEGLTVVRLAIYSGRLASVQRFSFGLSSGEWLALVYPDFGPEQAFLRDKLKRSCARDSGSGSVSRMIYEIFINYMNEILSLSLEITVCTLIEIEFPVSLGLLMKSTERGAGNIITQDGIHSFLTLRSVRSPF
uniref:Uncharacterized protein n=1 Tax=Cucumis melo TaxID=3656 RepID=A0A9I9EGD0_CUCME